MKIGILTFHCANNYGAVLQAYGLQEYLKDLGHEVFIIDYRPKYLLAPYKVFGNKLPNVHLFLKILYWLRSLLIAPKRWKRIWEFNAFRKKYLNTYQFNFSKIENDFDIFIFGSDQIWNPIITHGIDKIFFGDFNAASMKKLVAYSASAGSVHNVSNDDVKYIVKQLRKFNSIGIREKSFASLLHSFALDCHVTLDPVLLAGRSVFDRISINRISENNYLLLFQLDYDYRVEKIALHIANIKGLNIVKINSSSESVKDWNIKSSVSPTLFLSYIKNAMYVVTSSFHGTALSILFEKDFTSVCLNEQNGERITNLLEQLNLKDRIITFENQKIKTNSINYKAVENLQYTLKKSSIEFINKALNSNVSS